ncbi:hypothetical protein BGX30_002451 [Mortierella sp. GBA39]|nr:hypothetical protein BGX30_002451 [Mortierella sp. GBA39]
MSKYKQLFRGTAFSSKSSKEIEILKDHLFCIHDDGKIEKIVAPEDADYQVLLDAYQGKDNFYSLAEGQYILPGFIDLHVHAPQWAQSGTALDIPLYDWLNTYTFPLESKFSDLDFAYEVYDDLSVMAHCNFLSDDDADLFAETGTAVAHCPISNAYFANSVIPVAHLHEKGVEIGLGTDISGGFSPSLFDNIRQAVMSSRMLEDGVNPALPAEDRGVPGSRITVNEAFYFATAGGGESLSLPVGRIQENYAWDVQIIDTKLPSAKLPIFDPNEDLNDVFQKMLYLARPENIREVWVQGEKVHSR